MARRRAIRSYPDPAIFHGSDEKYGIARML
jgi:hypothetical protein